jgi:fusaric acid resistance family protein
VIATHVVQHRQPFFAPIAAVVSLNATRGERGSNTVRLLLGVIVGILVGELAIAVNGRGYGSLGGATLVAMIGALAISGERLVIAQAAAGAILTVAAPIGEAGPQRLVDALIGAGVALLISQLLFPAEPVALLRRAQAAAVHSLGEGLRLTASALGRDDPDMAARATDSLRAAPGRLADLARARKSSGQVMRWSPVWRRREGPVVQEEENAAQLDLLAGSCLMLTRAALALDRPAPPELIAAVGDLAAALETVAGALGNREARQRTADRALEVARRGPDAGLADPAELGFAWMAVRTAAQDVMVFAGVDPEQARQALTESHDALRIPAPPATPRTPFRRRGA